MPRAVTSRYASALAEVVAASPLSAETVAAELKSFTAAMDSSAELRNALESPSVAPGRKRAVISRLSEMLGLSRIVKNFLLVSSDHRRTHELPEIIQSFEAQIDARLGIVRAGVSSAASLEPGQENALSDGLAKVTGKQVRLVSQVDPALIGGVSVRIGSTVYDGSVRGRLEAMGRRLRSE